MISLFGLIRRQGRFATLAAVPRASPSWYVTRSTGLSAAFAAVVAVWAAVLLDSLAWQERVRKLTDEFRRLRADLAEERP